MTKSFTDITAASRAVLVDVLGVLGAYRSHLVVIGGWVPELRFPGRGHPGSLDVDLVQCQARGQCPRQGPCRRHGRVGGWRAGPKGGAAGCRPPSRIAPSMLK